MCMCVHVCACVCMCVHVCVCVHAHTQTPWITHLYSDNLVPYQRLQEHTHLQMLSRVATPHHTTKLHDYSIDHRLLQDARTHNIK